MGCFIEKMKDQEAIIGCLNYSGIQDSPYQFFETENEQEKHINQIFSDVCSRNIKNFDDPKFKWQIGKFDKQWHTRYTPIYLPSCGVKENKKLMNSEQFFEKWEQTFKQQFPKYEGKIYAKTTEQQKQKTFAIQKEECRLFDFCVYETLLRYIYKIEDMKKVQLDAKDYLEHQRHAFHKAYLDEELKLSLTLKSLKVNRIDVFFVQEGNANLLKSLEIVADKFYIVQKLAKNCTSMIMIRRQKFAEVKDFRKENEDFMKEYNKRCGCDAQKDLFWNSDTVFQAVGKNLLISTHLSSKKERTPEQMKQMKCIIQKFMKLFPEYNFIIGGDLNGDFQFGFDIILQAGEKKWINVYPDKDTQTTVNKKRTLMQAQKHKANQLSNGVKDYIVTSYPFVTQRIVTVNNILIEKGKNMPMLPNAEHPYDHYLVAAKINME